MPCESTVTSEASGESWGEKQRGLQLLPTVAWSPRELVPTGGSIRNETRDPLGCLLKALSKKICGHRSLPHSHRASHNDTWQPTLLVLGVLCRGLKHHHITLDFLGLNS